MSCLVEGPRKDVGTTSCPITVLIADDHPVVIGGIRRALEGHDDIEVVGEAHSGPEVLALIERRRPRFVLLDLNMPGVVGLECVEQIATRWPHVKIIVLSACEDRGVINGAFAAGATAYVLKSVMTMDVASVLHQASTGGIFHAATGQGAAPREMSPPEPQAGLTGREQTILTAVAQGLTTSAISQQLWVSEHTVKFHLTNIYRKLGVPNRAAAVRYALEHRLVAQ
ncbi:MAG TPA: response regulator transcription factor [Solirubrobacteraceae bacterium]|nr:response regulator transcription factor [Solirubrobacteraceae bacterium]